MQPTSFHEIIEKFNERTHDVEPLLVLSRDSELQLAAIHDLEILSQELESFRAAASAAKAEDPANILLGFKCIVSGLISELRVYRSLKRDHPNDAWDALIRSQSSFSAAIRAHSSFGYVEGKYKRLREMEKHFFPSVQFLSAGMIVKRQVCSICDDDFSKCDHLAGRAYCGEFCHVKLLEVEGDHVALVDEPANRLCRIVAFSTPAGRRDVLSWRITGPNRDETEASSDQMVAESIIFTLNDDAAESYGDCQSSEVVATRKD
ncbi:hypothetical protein [Novosphingobium sp. fls2-241-R2A-195]|uniref:hypothetical protein n=1 Tax=Novosphingobium sp. fls2-241-R2A-195 TaxID=3040296 RepID=UPI00254B1D53|nr:hypothetical protein [Novosphingobium sp. fls2-241-R2A-195]